MTRTKFNRRGFFSKLALILLVFLFIFTSQPGLVLAAEEAVSVDSAPTDSAESAEPDISAPAAEAQIAEDTTVQPADNSSEIDQAKQEDESENPPMETLTSEEEVPLNLMDPKNPGAEKLNVDTDPSTGALSYTLPLVVPPGRNNMQPDLKLVYNSQNSENESILGFGWSLSIPFIKRVNKIGVDNLYTESYFTSSLSGELMPVDLISGDYGEYGSKTDNGEFLKYEFSDDDSWLVTDKTGTQYKFGLTTNSRQDDPDDSTKIYKWQIEKIIDTNGNFIKFEYYKDGGQIYPDKIKYTGYDTDNGIFEIEFLRESRTDISPIYNAGFEITTSYRIYEIKAKVSGTWVKKYSLTYGEGDNGERSVISGITESGQDGQNNVITLPASSFEYQANEKDWEGTEDWYPPCDLRKGVIVADVNGDGLPDILRSYSPQNEDPDEIATYLNDGHGGWIESEELAPPLIFYYDEVWNGWPYDNGVRAADVNGDGLTDLVQSLGASPSSIHKIYFNTGTGWSMQNIDYIPTFGSAQSLLSHGTFFAEINGDGLPDIIQGYKPTGWQPDDPISGSVSLNNGDNTWAIQTNLVPPADLRSGTIIADFNGDGLEDVMRSWYWHAMYEHPELDRIEQATYINDGNGGWIEDENLIAPVIFYEDWADWYAYPIDNGVRAADVNGDGLTDLVQSLYLSSPGIHRVFINTGHGWLQQNTSYIPLFGGVLNNSNGNGVHISDINGDSLPDIIYGYKNSNPPPTIGGGVVLNMGFKADLLSESTNAKGGEFSVTYKASPQYIENDSLQNPDLPFAVQTVNYIEYNDSFDNLSSESYFYVGGDYYYEDYLNRKFAGFNQIAKVDGDGNVAMTFFHQGNGTDTGNGEYLDDASKIGKPYRTEIYDDSANLFRFSVNKWENYDLGDDRDFVKQTQTIGFAFDGNTSHKDTAETYAYDNDNGNLTQKITWGEVSGNSNGTFTDTGSDKYTTDIDYAATTGSDVIGLPSQETTIDQSSNKVKETKYYYDSLTLGNVDEGNLTKQEMWKSGTSYIDIEKTYNAYGLVTQEKDPQDKTTDYTYDTYNLYPATVTNALDQDTDYEYDYSLGKPTQVTDPNSRVFQTVYDALDRVKQEKQPYLSTPSTLVIKTEYTYTDNTVPTKVQQTNNLDSSTSFDIYTYLDGFGRKIQERKESEASNTYSAKDYAYNDVGLLDKESLPYFSTGSAQTTATTDTALYTSYTYDPLQRVLTATNAVGTTTNTYDDWKLTITDAESNVKDLYKDAYDNLIQVDEHNGANTYTTNYAYNGLGNLTQIEDSQDNIRNFTYDGLGRRLTAEDLHDPEDETFGEWTYGYDDSGNLTSRVDPKNQTVNWSYDDINRVLTENYTGQSGTEVAYVYDTGTDGIGRLYTATTADVVTTYTYNALGGVKTENKNIDSTNYLTEYGYDRQGNQILITYPNDDEVQYVYNTAGLLEKVQSKPDGEESFSDIVSDYDYSPLEQVAYQENANGVKTFNDYDEAKLYRLKEKITASPDEGDYGEGLMMATSSVIQSPAERDEESLIAAPPTVIQSPAARDEESSTPATLIGNPLASVGQAVGGFLETLPGVDIVTNLQIGYGSTDIKEASSNEKSANKVKRDFLGRPVRYDNYPKDETIYVKYDPNVKPEPLPKEAIEMFDKAKESQKEPELKYLPQGMIDFLEKQKESLGENMLLSVNPPDPSTDLLSEDLWKSANILYNSGFEDGFDSWNWQNELDATHTEDCTVSHSGSCSEKVIVSTTGEPWEVHVGQSVKLLAGKNYTWKFWAKASTATEFFIQAYQNHSPWTQQGIYRTIEAGTDWQEYSYTFTVAVDDENSIITFHLGDNAGTYWIDDVSLTPDDLNMITDPSFENWGNTWYFTSKGYPDGTGTNAIDDTESYDGNSCDKVTVTTGGGYWEVSLAQPISVVEDQTYILTFYAHSENYDPRTARAAITLNYNPFSEISSVVPFDTVWNNGEFAKFQIELTPNVTESDARLIFYLGEETSWIKLDQVRLWPQQATKISDTTPELSAIYDDPDTGDSATDYQIQVIKYDGNWNDPIWDSGKTAFTNSVDEGDRSEDISYGGDALMLDGMKYYWRIKLWDESDNEGEWTNGNDYFVMAGKRIQDLAYTYDDVGNITEIVDQSETNTRKNAAYAYDDLYRLTSATITDSATEDDYTQTFTYDSLGNILSKSDVGDYEYNGNTGSLYANPHAVTDFTDLGVEVSYDNNGNMDAETLGAYTVFEADWDYNNRMATSDGIWATPASYGYDHAGQRIIKDIDSGSEIIVYPNKYFDKKIVGEDETITENVYANNQLVLTITDDGTNRNEYYVHDDHLTSSSVMTKDDGDVEQVVDYYPFGNMRFNEQSDPENGSFDQRKKFTQKEIETDSSGLQYFGARYYSGEAGRFVSEDPMFLDMGTDLRKKYGKKSFDILIDPQSLNSYSYVANRPFVYVDPTGEGPVGIFTILNVSLTNNFVKNNLNMQSGDSNIQGLNKIYNYANNLTGGNTEETLYVMMEATRTSFNSADVNNKDRKERIFDLPSGLFGQYTTDTFLDNTDKLQHFFASALLSYMFGPETVNVLGNLVENWEIIFTSGREKYDFNDIQANQLGAQFGQLLKENPNASLSDFLNSNNSIENVQKVGSLNLD